MGALLLLGELLPQPLLAVLEPRDLLAVSLLRAIEFLLQRGHDHPRGTGRGGGSRAKIRLIRKSDTFRESPLSIPVLLVERFSSFTPRIKLRWYRCILGITNHRGTG